MAATYLASIFGTEQDKVNCSFYYKIGACRHGDRCSRKHTRPVYSQTILISNVYQNPRHLDPSCTISDDELQRGFDRFYEDWFCELSRYGSLVEMHVCDNVGDHLIGNVYARYEFEEEAQRAVDALNDRWYDGRPLFAELSPVTDFREACCRQNETNECNRGGFCNFMHLRYPSRPLLRQLHHELGVELRERAERKRRGWKDEVDGGKGGSSKASANGGGDESDVPAWKRGRSGGDWRRANASADDDEAMGLDDGGGGGGGGGGGEGPSAGAGGSGRNGHGNGDGVSGAATRGQDADGSASPRRSGGGARSRSRSPPRR